MSMTVMAPTHICTPRAMGLNSWTKRRNERGAGRAHFTKRSRKQQQLSSSQPPFFLPSNALWRANSSNASCKTVCDALSVTALMNWLSNSAPARKEPAASSCSKHLLAPAECLEFICSALVAMIYEKSAGKERKKEEWSC